MAGYIGSKSSVTLVDGYTEAEADAEFVNDPSSVITVTSNEKVGLGTDNPLSSVHMAASSGVTGYGNSILLIEDTGGDYSGVMFKGSTNYNAAIRTEGSSAMTFWRGDTSGTPYFVKTMRIDSDGLKFNSDTAAANALNDYEEGSFTPTVFDGNGNLTPTYVTANTFGRYTKIGSLVTFDLEVRTSAVAGPRNGYLRVGGLPFNLAANPNQPLFALSMYNIAFNTGYLYTAEFEGASGNTLYIRETRNNTTSGQMVSSSWSGNNPTLIRIAGSYRT
jgi:hypothetical protein